VKREGTRSIKGNPPRRVGKKVVKNEEESTGSEDFNYGGAVSVVALEPREEYSAAVESGARLKDWKKGGEVRTQVAFEFPGLNLSQFRVFFVTFFNASKCALSSV